MSEKIKTVIREKAKYLGQHSIKILKWAIMGIIVGMVVGGISIVFSTALKFVTGLREKHTWIVYGLPAGGLLIVGFYRLLKVNRDKGTNLVMDSITSNRDIPIKMTPLILVGTIVTHMFGGSAGREGAALQLGGSLGNYIGKLFKFDNKDKKVMIMCGMSAAFSALFGTPMAAAIFAIESATVGIMYFASLLPCVISALIASHFSANMGISPESFPLNDIPDMTMALSLKTALLALLCALLSVVFCFMMKYVKKILERLIKNAYLRIVAASLLFIGITFLVGDGRYYGAGIEVIDKAVIEGEAVPYDFIMKMLLTALTLGAGFKGGEIVPSFYVGATFGCVFGHVLGMSPTLCAAMGMTAMFCGITNCPITAMLISFELFGFESVPHIMIVTAISFVSSGYVGIYSSQKIVYSKYKPQIKQEFENHVNNEENKGE